jgi:hypothetical protein
MTLTRTDVHHHPQITVRRWYDDDQLVRAYVYVGGWRVAILKTERGIANRVAREIAAIESDLRGGELHES